MCLRILAMDFNIPLSTGQSVLILHFGPDGAESQETLKCSDKFRGSVGSTGAVRIATSSELGICNIIWTILTSSWSLWQWLNS